MWRSKGDNHKETRGERAERSAERWLLEQGLRVIERNYRCKAGEIDLVMREGETVVFVEVRYRKQHGFGSGIESVDWRKQKKLLLAARHFLVSRKQYADMPCRFDVMAASPAKNDGKALTWQHIENAFGL